MKTLLFILLIGLASCSPDDPGPALSSVVGLWTFKDKQIQGSLKIIDGFSVESGEFRLNDTDFKTKAKQTISVKDDVIELLELKSEEITIYFHEGKLKGDKIIFDKYEYVTLGGGYIGEEITFNRKI